MIGWFNGSVSIDRTIGNKTSFLVIYERSPPDILVLSPYTRTYDTSHFKHDAPAKTLTLDIEGTAEVCLVVYILCVQLDSKVIFIFIIVVCIIFPITTSY